MHDPELLIRTGGERRLSNYLLWQVAESELVFSDELWPDFSRGSFEAAIEEFRRRKVVGGRAPWAGKPLGARPLARPRNWPREPGKPRTGARWVRLAPPGTGHRAGPAATRVGVACSRARGTRGSRSLISTSLNRESQAMPSNRAQT